MKRLFLDTEFNAFGGKLISMALVPEDDEIREFYVELDITDQLDPWVRDNVAPHLFLAPCTYNEFQVQLSSYLYGIGECEIVADWPDDIRYFCEALITGPGESINLHHRIKFDLNTFIRYNSLVPHNALHDALAIKEYYKNEISRNKHK